MVKEFDLPPFRKKFWVAVNAKREEISSKLCVEVHPGQYSELSEDVYDSYAKSNAVTFRAYDKETNFLGYLIVILKEFDRVSELVDCLAHEACHVSDLTQLDIGVQNGDTEIGAHLTGYVAGKEMITWNEERKESEIGGKDD